MAYFLLVVVLLLLQLPANAQSAEPSPTPTPSPTPVASPSVVASPTPAPSPPPEVDAGVFDGITMAFKWIEDVILSLWPSTPQPLLLGHTLTELHEKFPAAPWFLVPEAISSVMGIFFFVVAWRVLRRLLPILLVFRAMAILRLLSLLRFFAV